MKEKFDFQRYLLAENFIESLSSFDKIGQGNKEKKKTVLQRTQLFLNLLGNPEKKIKLIHIAGTAGKGSVSKIIQYQIGKNGYKCGLYTSPHVTATTERIQINEKYISGMKYAEIVEELKPKLQTFFEKRNFIPSYFEINFAISLLYFAREKCDFAVIETGMGGRFDCTNVVNPIITVITNVGIDHIEYLGDTKEKIAFEKAGIIKQDIDMFSAEDDPKIVKILQTHAINKSANASFLNIKNIIPKKTFPRLIFEFENEIYSSTMLGISQIKNILLAKKVIEKMKLKFEKNIYAFLPARLEIIQKSPLIVLDGAHNELKIQNFKDFANSIPHKKLHIIFSLVQDKKLKEIITILKSIKKEKIFYLTKIPSMIKKSASFKDMQKLLKNENFKTFIDPALALNQAKIDAGENSAILSTGSFYLAGYLREQFIKKEKILKTSNFK